MKKFEDIKIVGLFQSHDNESFVEQSINAVNKYVNAGIYYNLNDPTPFIKMVVENYKKQGIIKEVVYSTNNGQRWDQGKIRDISLRMLDTVRPDIVVWFDDDEEPPKNFAEQLRKFWEDETKKSWWGRLLYLWDNKIQFRNDRYWRCIHTCRMFKWEEGLTFLPKYPGYTCPRNLITLPKETRYNSDMPIIHWGYMNEEDRQRKFKRANSDYCNPEMREKIDKNKLILPIPEEYMPKI